MKPYPDLDPQPDLPAVERAVLARWAEDATFEASIAAREGAPEFVFYDGPPFANGLPHYGHLLTGFVKDAVPRYKTMRGYRVPRRFGWDCHGLPAEMAVEQELALSGRAAILEMGVDRFNDACRASVLRYTSEWRDYVTRQARWVSFDDEYKTMDLPYMESVLWAFKSLYDKGLLYEGYRVLPYCWECETPLSNFEIRLDEATRDRQDPAITVLFDLDEPVAGTPTRAVAWTTTPWTLPSNLALAVGPDLDYVVVSLEGSGYLLAASRLDAYQRELGGGEVVARLKGSDLVGRTYRPLFPYFAGHEGAFRILPADYVTDDDGTGIVHTAPGFGEEDKETCDAAGIAVVCPVDDRGRFTAEVADYQGLQVFEANRPIIRRLAEAGHLVREDSYVHAYPHCWRTDTPLIYRAVTSWFVAVTAIKQRALELNEQITWVPEHVKKGAFGSWLAGAHDWSISRNRFWGAPIPVWKSDDPAHPRVDVYGSLDELERDFGVRPTDLHRPYIDELTRPNPDDPTGRSTMRRVTDVLDCWFESGSMPYAQVHYPFERGDWFESHFPADFIVEYVGQTRAWFYNLHVLGTALFDRPPFETCVAHGILLGNDGVKLSKKLRNYPDPGEAFERYGADAMRWSLLSSPSALRAGNVVVSEEPMAAAVREAVMPIWSACSFFTLYANTGSSRARWRADSPHVLDRYVLAKAHELVASATAAMDAYDISGTCAALTRFVDALNNWYIRRSRDRFWAVGSTPDPDAVDTLYTVLEVLLRVAAPLLPLTSEHLWTGLTGERSVHLADWPDASLLPADDALVSAMDTARQVVSAGHAIRKAERLRVRLPLASVAVSGSGATALEPLRDLVADELNVREVVLAPAMDGAGEEVLTVNPRVLGPRLGGRVQEVLKAAKAGRWERREGTVVVGGEPLGEGEYELRLTPADERSSRAIPEAGLIVRLDLEVTAELAAEGLARDVVRLVQQARKDAGLDVGDRIELGLELPTAEASEAVAAHRDRIAGEVLAVRVVESGPVDAASYRAAPDLAGHGPVGVTLRRA